MNLLETNSMRTFVIRACIIIIVLISSGYLGYSWINSDIRGGNSLYESTYESGNGRIVAPDRSNITIVSTNRRWSGRIESGVIAFSPDGRVTYYDDTYYTYGDVDPISNSNSFSFIASNLSDEIHCEGYDEGRCTLNIFEIVNLSTKKSYTDYEEVTRLQTDRGSINWHDVDRINETHYLVADIAHDRVLIINIRTGEIDWSWNASDTYSPESGGQYPTDWTHINDVEILPDGRIMASIRNHDQVIFIKPGEGLLENWTLGCDDCHDILFEQHNPDYIPDSRGGPAVLVADSENDRVVEYQRVNGNWERSWVWSDSRMQWPRDADRLPNGHTLIVDSHGGRVLEVNTTGEIVWSIPIALPYDGERVGTGEESASGYSAASLNLTNRVTESSKDRQAAINESVIINEKRAFRLENILSTVLPESIAKLVSSGLMFVTPGWMLGEEILMFMIFSISIIVGIIHELYIRI